MKNFEKYKTAEERHDAFSKFCDSYQFCAACPLEGRDRDNCNRFKWLDLEAEEKKPMLCPFCGRQCVCVINEHENFVVRCTNCDYTYGNAMDKEETVKAHNRVCKAVEAYKENNENN